MVDLILIDQLSSRMKKKHNRELDNLWLRLNALKEEERLLVHQITQLQVKELRVQLGDDTVEKTLKRVEKKWGSSPKAKTPTS